MAVINEVKVGSGSTALDANGIADDLLDAVRREIAEGLWVWFNENRDREITTIGVWFINFTVKVAHVEPLFELLFGPNPAGA